MRTARSLVAATALAVLLGGCGAGGDVRGFLEDSYQRQGASGDTVTYTSAEPVGTVAAAIAAAEAPAARQADGGSEYLRYSDDIVVVGAAGGGGSTIRVEDLDAGYRGGAFIFLGAGFTPGSPAGGSPAGGPGDSK